MKVRLNLVLLFVLLGIYFIRADYQPAPFSDENVYYCMAKEVSEGSVPYRDFFFAHPPLLILPQALLFLVFGPGFLVGRLVPILSGAAILALAYLIGEELEKGSGIFASVVVLSSYSFGLMSGRGIGVAFSLALVLGSVYLSLKQRDGWAGLLLALSMLVRLSNFPVFLVLAGYHVWKRRWEFVQGMAALGLFGLLTLIPNFVQDVFIYHTLKSAVAGKGGALVFAYNEWIIVGMVVLALLVKWDERKALVGACAASGVLVLLLAQVRAFYLAFTVPFIALIVGIGMNRLVGMAGGDGTRKNMRWLKPAALGLFVAILAFNAYANSFPEAGLEPGLERIFDGLEPPVFDTSSPLGAFYCVEYGGRISGKLIDMYPVRVLSGAIDWGESIQRLEGDKPRFIIDNRGEFVGHTERDMWLETGLRDFVYGKYVPSSFMTISDNKQVVIVWEQAVPGPRVEFGGGMPAGNMKYAVTYYTGNIGDGEVRLDEGNMIRAGAQGDVQASKEFVEFLESHIVLPAVVAVGAWDVPEIGHGSHWIVEGDIADGGAGAGVSSETWVLKFEGRYILFTESRDIEKTVAFIIQEYVPGEGIISREIYQNIAGGFVKVYEETRIE